LYDRQLEQRLQVLAAEFSAAIVAEEELAANDLAFSLAQDVPLHDELRRCGARLKIAEAEIPVTHLGHDFVVAGPWVARIDRAVLVLDAGVRPAGLPQVFLGKLRALARARARVTVGVTGGHDVRGSLEQAAPTHVIVAGRERCAVPVPTIDYVRLSRGGSVDEP